LRPGSRARRPARLATACSTRESKKVDEVVLERLLNGAACGTTHNVEAGDPAEAERFAVEAWERAAPQFRFRPLLTQKVPTGDGEV
jgi:hypothetical protein